MSKSRGNVVHPDEYIDRAGADAFRTYLMFLGPYEAGGDFSDDGLRGVSRFLDRVWRAVTESEKRETLSESRRRLMHQVIKKVTRDMESFSFNTAIAALMEWVKEMSNTTQSDGGRCQMSNIEARVLLRLLAPFAPHLTEELWQTLFFTNDKTRGNGARSSQFRKCDSIHLQPWPEFDPQIAQAGKVTVVVQVDGKLRDKLEMERGLQREAAEKQALDSEKVQKYLRNKTIKRVVYVPDKLINFVTV